MKRTIMVILTFFLCIVLISSLHAAAAETINSGKFGNNLRWKVDSDWVLTISGKGEMENFFNLDKRPWKDYYLNVRKIVVEEGITCIGYNAFYNFGQVEEVVLPSTLKKINGYAFSSCNKLQKINFPEKLKEIGDHVFSGCGFTQLEIPDTWETLGSNVFMGCSSLTTLHIPDVLPNRADGMFRKCTGLVSVVIEGDKVHTGMFEECTSLRYVTLSDGIETLETSAFSGCTALTSIVIPDSITTIKALAFWRCKSLAYLYISKNLSSVDTTAFNELSGAQHVLFGGTQEQWDSLGIGQSIGQYCEEPVHTNASVEQLNTSVTCSKTSLNCEICDKVFVIPLQKTEHSFEYGICTKCGIEEHWKYYFQDNGILRLTGCSDQLETLVVPGYFEGYPITDVSLGNVSFRKNLKHLVIEEGPRNIEAHSFMSSLLLETVELPSSVRSIGDMAFSKCESLKQIVIPQGVEELVDSTFYGCSALSSVTIPSSLRSIGNLSFYNDTSITSVHISDLRSWFEIDMDGAEANPLFYGAVLYVNGASAECVVIPEGVETIGAYTMAYPALEAVIIPNSVTNIEPSAFVGCEALKHVVYTGAQSQWALVTVGENNDAVTKDVHFGVDIQTTDGTCDQPGSVAYVCADCGEVIFRYETAAIDHQWSDWEQTVAPSAEADGEQTRRCLLCGCEERKNIAKNPFTDVKADRFEDAILWAYYKGITSGTGEGTTFSPEITCTRKQIVTFLWRYAGEPEPKSMENPFRDVKQDRFEKAILWAYHEGITSGTGDGTTFSPEDKCTRKQIVTFLWRSSGKPEPASGANPFSDVKFDSFEKAILWAYYRGITSGTGKGLTFSPESACSRKQIVTFLYRANSDAKTMPEDQTQTVAQAYALAEGEALEYIAVLTGRVQKIVTPWSEDTGSVSVIIQPVGCEANTILCVSLQGADAAGLAYSDMVTVIGTLRKYENIVQFTKGCILADMVKGDGKQPEDVGQILREAYALQPGEKLPYEVTLTGRIYYIQEQRTQTNGGAIVSILIGEHYGYPIWCERLVGDRSWNLRDGDVITVTGTISNLGHSTGFISGCESN